MVFYMEFFEPFLTALSLCADCFAVSLCSSVSIRHIDRKHIMKLAIFFAIVQTGLLAGGWLFGKLFLGLIQTVSGIIGGALLIYVGFSMLMEGVRDRSECHKLNGWRNVFLAAIATSIDALAVGAAGAMNPHATLSSDLTLIISCFVLTFASVCAGILGARFIGRAFGRWAEIVGGAVLLGLGVSFILGSL